MIHSRGAMRRGAWLGLGALALGGAGCAQDTPHRGVSAGSHAPVRPAPLLHIVLIRLKNPLDVRDLSRDSLAAAAQIPGVTACFAGLPLDTGRSAVDGTYDLCFTLGFDNQGAYEAYLAHPAHVALLNTWRDRIDTLRIYDALDVRPEREAPPTPGS